MHSSILFFVVFMGVLRWGWGENSCPPGHPSVTFGDSVPPLALRATSPVSGESVLEGEPLGAALIVAPLEGSLRLSKKCIVGASSARP